jgi:integrase
MKKETAPKVKEPIRIRFKELKNGNKSIYLDYYNNGNRQYEFLKHLYIIPETSSEAKIKNTETLRKVKAIQSDKIWELENNTHGLSVNSGRNKIKLLEYVKHITEKKKSQNNFTALHKHLEIYRPNAILKDVDKSFCVGFIDYLKTAKNPRTGQILNTNTQFQYLRNFTTIINAAIDDEMLSGNPLLKIKDKPKQKETQIEYLLPDEVKTLENTPCKSQKIKNAFLFSCYTGLRYSDVSLLTWDKIQKDNDRVLIKFIQKKTGDPEYLPLSKKAVELLPKREPSSDTDKVFYLQAREYVNVVLKFWAMEAGIKKRLTFHVARHTHATLLLNKGVNIETVSKALGHSDIKVTQRYAKITDLTLLEAVKTLDEL